MERYLTGIKSVQTASRENILSIEQTVLASLPEPLQAKMLNLIYGMSDVGFFHPDGKPKANWKVFHSNSLEDARNQASEAYSKEVLKNAKWTSGPIRSAITHYSGKNFIDIAEHAAEAAGRGKATDIKIRTAATSEEAATFLYQLSTYQQLRQDETVLMARELIVDAALQSASPLAPKEERVTPYILDGEFRDAAARLGALTYVSDLAFEKKEQYAKYINEEWEVWKKGYCALFEDNGIFYVYFRDE